MIKSIDEKCVLYFRHELASPMEIGEHAAADEPRLRELAAQHGLKIAGPLEHAYWNMAIQGVPHILEIWLPVFPPLDSIVSLPLKKMGAFHCFTAEFTRPIFEIGDAWAELGNAARGQGIAPSHHDREVYYVMDCDRPERNRIELQFGIG
jgi:hypothetical protein